MVKVAMQQVVDAFDDFSFRTPQDLANCVEATIRSALPNAKRSMVIVDGAACSGKSRLMRTVWALVQPRNQMYFSDGSVLCKDADFARWSRDLARRGQRIALVDAGHQYIGCAALESFLASANFHDRLLGDASPQELLRPAIWVEWRLLQVAGYVRPHTLRNTRVISILGCQQMPVSERVLAAAREALAQLRLQNPSAEEIDRLLGSASLPAPDCVDSSCTRARHGQGISTGPCVSPD
jgi:hypothetical protein